MLHDTKDNPLVIKAIHWSWMAVALTLGVSMRLILSCHFHDSTSGSSQILSNKVTITMILILLVQAAIRLFVSSTKNWQFFLVHLEITLLMTAIITLHPGLRSFSHKRICMMVNGTTSRTATMVKVAGRFFILPMMLRFVIPPQDKVNNYDDI